ncbi:hypothetical protein EJB05_40488, partial [Eragrostis curvula]
MASITAAAAVLLLLTLSTSATASKVKFNVTEMLREFPEFSTFNNLLSQTKLADEINQRQTITVLVVDNGAAGAITSLPADTQKKVLAAQVILDYYDPVKLDGIKDKAAQLTTLFQASGGATGQSGFLNYKEGADDQMAFGSAEPGAPLASKLVKVVASRPYNISVMQISAPIVPPSIGKSGGGGGGGKGGAPSPAAAKENASSPAVAPSKKPEEAPKEASAPTAEDGEASAPSSEDGSAPATEEPSPVVAEGPSDEDSAASPPAESEKSTDATADAPTSAGTRTIAGASVVLVGLTMWMIN